MSQSDLAPVAIVAGWRRDLLLLLTQTRTNERALSVDHGGEVMQRVQSSELRVQEVMCGRSVEREEEERLVGARAHLHDQVRKLLKIVYSLSWPAVSLGAWVRAGGWIA